jgi:hypothetical protein
MGIIPTYDSSGTYGAGLFIIKHIYPVRVGSNHKLEILSHICRASIQAAGLNSWSCLKFSHAFSHTLAS